MRTHRFVFSAAFGLALQSACATGVPPGVTAASVERTQCDTRVTTPEAMQLLTANSVLRVDPIYTHIIVTPNNAEERVLGAKLTVRPPSDVTAEVLTRVLQCHSARVLLGKASGTEIPNDPYWVADQWLDIQVRPEGGNLAVSLSADTVHDNIELLGRAKRYAHDHVLAVQSVP